jgi:NitT/TauT family transport system substrate-binding protein
MKRAVFSALAAATVFAPQLVRAQKMTTVRIGVSPTESYALAYFALQQGFFAKNGIDAQLTVVPGASGGTAAALVGGALDVGCVSMGPLASAHLRGIPLKILAAGAIVRAAEQTTVIVVADGSPIQTPRELNGKTVGTVVLKDVMHVATLKYIDVNGGDSKTVRITELPMPDSGPAIVSGRIDAYPMSEPTLSASVGKGIRAIAPAGIYAAIAPRTMISINVAMSDWLDKNPAAAHGVVVAMRQAAQWANANPAGVATILESVAKLPPATFGRMKHVVYGETLEPGAIQPQIDVLAEYAFIGRRIALDELVWPPAKPA